MCAAAVLAIMPGTLRRTRVSGAGAWGDDKPAWAAWACGEPEANGDRLGTDGADSFESTANREGNSQSSHLPGSSAGSTGEIWEIIVSATRIVEIRIMSANCGQINESRAADATDGAPAPEHSTAARANYYQTRGGGTEIASDRAEVPHRRGVGGFIADAFKKWSRWGRKAVGKSRAENF